MFSHGISSGPAQGVEDEFNEDLLEADEAVPDPASPDPASAAALHRTYDVPDETGGMRIDKALAGAFADLSRARIQALLSAGRVSATGQTIMDPARRVKPGEIIALVLPPPEPAIPEPENIPLEIYYEDEHLLVLNKPAGLVVHPAAGHARGTLVNALLFHCGAELSGIGGVSRPGIVHRLDKDTSGVMVVAKSEAAHHGLSVQFRDHSLTRTYRAFTWGVPVPAAGTISGAIGRCLQDRKRMAVLTRGGKPALTRYRTTHRYQGGVAEVACRLATGRTHQVRVHLSALGYPLVGDAVYGPTRPRSNSGRLPPEVFEALTAFPRQALHAAELAFIHPVTGAALAFTAPLPADLEALSLLLQPSLES